MVEKTKSQTTTCRVAELKIGDRIAEEIYDKEGYVMYPSDVVCDLFVIKNLKLQKINQSIAIIREKSQNKSYQVSKKSIVKRGWESYEEYMQKVESIWGKERAELSFSAYSQVHSSLALRIDNIFELGELSPVSLSFLHDKNLQVEVLIREYEKDYKHNKKFQECLQEVLFLTGRHEKKESWSQEWIKKERHFLSFCLIADMLSCFPFESQSLTESGVILTYLWMLQMYGMKIESEKIFVEGECEIGYFALRSLFPIYISCFHFSSYMEMMEDIKDGYNQDGSLEKTFGLSERALIETLCLYWKIDSSLIKEIFDCQERQEKMIKIDLMMKMNMPVWENLYYLSEEQEQRVKEINRPIEMLELDAFSKRLKKIYILLKNKIKI